MPLLLIYISFHALRGFEYAQSLKTRRKEKND
jgi:hypothetical protein